MLTIGFATFDGFAVRVDILERIAAQLRACARASAIFDVPATLASEAGLTRAELGILVTALGFRRADEGASPTAYTRPNAPRRERQNGRRSASSGHSHSPFAVLAGLRLAPRA